MKSGSVSITGATGFLGCHLAGSFLRDGWRVRAIVRPGNRKPVPNGVDTVESPLAQAWLARAFEGSDVVVHAAAVIRARNDAAFQAVNVEGTRAAVEAANLVGARFLHLSSQAAIGPATAARPAREDDPPHPINAYGRSKLASEEVVRAHARTPWTILRPSAVYGPRDRGFLPLFRLASRGVTCYAAPPATSFTFVYVDDLVRAARSASEDERAIGRTFFVGHPDPRTSADLLREIAGAVGRPFRPWSPPPMLLDAAAWLGEVAWVFDRTPLIDRGRLSELRAAGFVCSADRLRNTLGVVAATPLETGIAQTTRWYREQGWLRR